MKYFWPDNNEKKKFFFYFRGKTKHFVLLAAKRMQRIVAFPYNNGYRNAQQFCIIRAFPILLGLNIKEVNIQAIFIYYLVADEIKERF